MLLIQTAFLSEAKPLIKLFKLQLCQEKTIFPIYEKETIKLVISGMGKIRAAAATSYLAAKNPTPFSAFINIGVAGHNHLPIGSGLFAHKIIDQGSSSCFYPTFTNTTPQKRDTVCTVDQAEKIFSSPYAYEMEASGFMQAALQFSTSELIHCYKVISDNLETPPTIDPKKVEDLIENNLLTIEPFLHYLLTLSNKLQDDPPIPLEFFLKDRKFSLTQRHQLIRLLKRLAILCPESLQAKEFAQARTAKDLFKALEEKIQFLPIRF